MVNRMRDLGFTECRGLLGGHPEGVSDVWDIADLSLRSPLSGMYASASVRRARTLDRARDAVFLKAGRRVQRGEVQPW